jgi:hypothetical protein
MKWMAWYDRNARREHAVSAVFDECTATTAPAYMRNPGTHITLSVAAIDYDGMKASIDANDVAWPRQKADAKSAVDYLRTVDDKGLLACRRRVWMHASHGVVLLVETTTGPEAPDLYINFERLDFDVNFEMTRFHVSGFYLFFLFLYLIGYIVTCLLYREAKE